MSKQFLIMFFLLLLSSCVTDNRTYEVSFEESIKSERLVIFETKHSYRLVYDRETGVEYFYAEAGFGGADFLTSSTARKSSPTTSEKPRNDIKQDTSNEKDNVQR